MQELLAIPIEELTRTSELGIDFGFEKSRADFQQLQGYFSKLNQVRFEEIPQNTLTQIHQALNQIKGTFDEIKTFSPQQLQKDRKDVVQSRDQISGQIVKRAQSLFNVSATPLALARTDESELENVRKSLSSSVEEIESLKRAATEAAKSAEKAAGRTGISEHAKIFLTEATAENNSTGWLVATMVLIVLTLIWGGISIFVSPEKAIHLAYDKSSTEISKEMAKFYLIQITVGKFIILSILSFTTTWFAKIYNAKRHNSVINKHRHNALKTFETFSSAAGGEKDVKNAVLLQATQTIFGHQPSGYLKNEATAKNDTKIIEITKSLVNKSDG